MTGFFGQFRRAHSLSSPWHLMLLHSMAWWVFFHKLLSILASARKSLLKLKSGWVTPPLRTCLWLLVSLKIKAKLLQWSGRPPHNLPDFTSYFSPQLSQLLAVLQLWPFPLTHNGLLSYVYMLNCLLGFKLCSDFTFVARPDHSFKIQHALPHFQSFLPFSIFFFLLHSNCGLYTIH